MFDEDDARPGEGIFYASNFWLEPDARAVPEGVEPADVYFLGSHIAGRTDSTLEIARRLLRHGQSLRFRIFGKWNGPDPLIEGVSLSAKRLICRENIELAAASRVILDLPLLNVHGGSRFGHLRR